MSLQQYHPISLMQAQSQQRGDAIALEGYGLSAPWQQISWRRFDEIGDQIAKALIASGFAAQDKVAILSQNCPQWTCADVGVLKAKAVVVPIYPTSTLEQARYIIDDAQAKLIFVGDAEQYRMARELLAICPSLTQIVVFDAEVALKQEDTAVHFDSLLTQTHSPEVDAELAHQIGRAHV